MAALDSIITRYLRVNYILTSHVNRIHFFRFQILFPDHTDMSTVQVGKCLRPLTGFSRRGIIAI
jgi:hypothetical protein